MAWASHYLWRDTPGDSYDLFAHLSDPILGDSCTYAKPLVFSNGAEGGTATDTATLKGLFDNQKPGCGNANTPDLVYTFTTSRELDLRASASGHTLSLRSATCNGAELVCGTYNLVRGSLPPGTYYLWIDPRDSGSTELPFTLSASLTPPVQGESCANPRPLAFSGGSLGGDALEQGDLNTQVSHSSSSCGGRGSDHVYTFTTSRTLNLRASTDKSHVLYLRSGDCPSQTEVACMPASTYREFEVTELAAGTYQLWVDSEYDGPYTLRASLTPSSCESPSPLVFTSGDGGTATATASGNTGSAFSTTQGSCGGTASRELAHAFELTEPRRLEATVTSTSPYLQPVLYLRASCGADELACAAAPSGNTSATLSTGELPPGRYYLWVDGFSGSAGPYTLSATLR